MSTLEQLNTYSNNTISFTDNRSSDVIFNYPTARDITLTINNQVTPIQTSIDILEIINPSIANIVFEIDLNAVAGATVQWGTLPSGISVIGSGLYSIYGIDSVSDWNFIVGGNIVLPPTFAGSFFYTCRIYYTSNGVRKTQEWQVGNYLPEALLPVNSSLICEGKRIRNSSAEFLITSNLEQYFYDAQLVNRFELTVESIAYNFGSASLQSNFILDLYQPLTNISNLTYQSNVANLLFAQNSPIIEDANAGSSTFEITFTVNNGKLSKDGGTTTNSTIVISGNITTVNNLLPTIKFYPTFDFTSTVSLTWSIKKSTVLLDNGRTNIIHTSEGTLSTRTYTFTAPQVDQLIAQTLVIPYEEIEYGKWDYLLVGGGGSGAAGGGGGGGQVRIGSNVILAHADSFPIVVGTGGARLTTSNFSIQTAWTRNGNSGNNTTALGITASGGQGGRSSANAAYSSASTWNFDGGSTASTSNTSIAGGFGAPIPTYNPNINEETGIVGAGGGGAGALQAGSPAYIRYYENNNTVYPYYAGGKGGDGVSNSITGVVRQYGGGGGGNHGYFGLGDPIALGGAGGGGNGFAGQQQLPATNGLDGFGGGGGAGSNSFSSGGELSWYLPGRGGSGIVILKVTPR